MSRVAYLGTGGRLFSRARPRINLDVYQLLFLLPLIVKAESQSGEGLRHIGYCQPELYHCLSGSVLGMMGSRAGEGERNGCLINIPLIRQGQDWPSLSTKSSD